MRVAFTSAIGSSFISTSMAVVPFAVGSWSAEGGSTLFGVGEGAEASAIFDTLG